MKIDIAKRQLIMNTSMDIVIKHDFKNIHQNEYVSTDSDEMSR